MKKARALIAFGVFFTVASGASAADKKKCMDAAPAGQELRDKGKLLAARDQFVVCADAACPAPVPGYCSEWLEDVKKRIPSFSLRVTDASGRDLPNAIVEIDKATYKIDGSTIELDPGPHELVAKHAGMKDTSQPIVLAQYEKGRVITIRLEPAVTEKPAQPAVAASTSTPAPPVDRGARRPIPIASFIGWGVGAAGLIGFGAFGLKANFDYNDYKDSCGNQCAPEARDDVKGTMVVADVFLAIGIAGAAVGTVFYLLSPATSPASR